MLRRTSWIALMAVGLWSCGGGDGSGRADREVAAERGSETAAAEASSGGSGRFTRESFILCPALEDHREELAAIVGFEQDPERALAGVGSECIVHGEDIGFARVALAPAVMPSIAMHVQGFEAETSPAPELGPDAVFVDGTLQPHVVFSMGPLIIDVDAENIETPPRETMIELALRVREILTAANDS